MKRKWFFLLEKLEIKRSERIAISALLFLLVSVSAYDFFQQPDANFDPEEYLKQEKIFEERSRAQQEEENMILARYRAPDDTGIDSRSEQKTGASLLPAAEKNTPPADTSSQNRTSSERININTADSETLQKLPGIGPAYAGRIIEWRDKNGKFTSKDQLLEIRGIGEKRLEAIKPLIQL